METVTEALVHSMTMKDSMKQPLFIYHLPQNRLPAPPLISILMKTCICKVVRQAGIQI